MRHYTSIIIAYLLYCFLFSKLITEGLFQESIHKHKENLLYKTGVQGGIHERTMKQIKYTFSTQLLWKNIIESLS